MPNNDINKKYRFACLSTVFWPLWIKHKKAIQRNLGSIIFCQAKASSQFLSLNCSGLVHFSQFSSSRPVFLGTDPLLPPAAAAASFLVSASVALVRFADFVSVPLCTNWKAHDGTEKEQIGANNIIFPVEFKLHAHSQL